MLLIADFVNFVDILLYNFSLTELDYEQSP